MQVSVNQVIQEMPAARVNLISFDLKICQSVEDLSLLVDSLKEFDRRLYQLGYTKFIDSARLNKGYSVIVKQDLEWFETSGYKLLREVRDQLWQES